mmetsp:Transcript_12588/g.36561  ORF Transcript_12588/g.36561 Transcript_12588/m.36561 type:complete len:109 (-) Transcript_12588:711-1037(-)
MDSSAASSEEPFGGVQRRGSVGHRRSFLSATRKRAAAERCERKVKYLRVVNLQRLSPQQREERMRRERRQASFWAQLWGGIMRLTQYVTTGCARLRSWTAAKCGDASR